MKKIVLFFVFLLAASAANAQETYLFAQRDTCSLYLDVYRPAEGTETTFQGLQKPTVVYVFGGGFITGHRDDPYLVDWFRRLAQNGYSVVSIDYRLGMKGYQVGKGLSGALKASDRFLLAQQVGVEDLFSAIGFLAENQEALGIDPDNLVLAGNSAGAIITLAAIQAIANGQTEGLPEGFRFKGAMSFAGAIISTSGAPRFQQATCPVMLLHGTADKAVAYKTLSLFGKGVWGSWYLAPKLKQAGSSYVFLRFRNRTHDVAAYMDYLWEYEQEFLEQQVMLGIPRQTVQTIDDPSLPTWKNISLNDIY